MSPTINPTADTALTEHCADGVSRALTRLSQCMSTLLFAGCALALYTVFGPHNASLWQLWLLGPLLLISIVGGFLQASPRSRSLDDLKEILTLMEQLVLGGLMVATLVETLVRSIWPVPWPPLAALNLICQLVLFHRRPSLGVRSTSRRFNQATGFGLFAMALVALVPPAAS